MARCITHRVLPRLPLLVFLALFGLTILHVTAWGGDGRFYAEEYSADLDDWSPVSSLRRTVTPVEPAPRWNPLALDGGPDEHDTSSDTHSPDSYWHFETSDIHSPDSVTHHPTSDIHSSNTSNHTSGTVTHHTNSDTHQQNSTTHSGRSDAHYEWTVTHSSDSEHHNQRSHQHGQHSMWHNPSSWWYGFPIWGTP